MFNCQWTLFHCTVLNILLCSSVVNKSADNGKLYAISFSIKPKSASECLCCVTPHVSFVRLLQLVGPGANQKRGQWLFVLTWPRALSVIPQLELSMPHFLWQLHSHVN